MNGYIAGIGGHRPDDYEYYRIIMQLQALGISPTGNKNADRARLTLEKEKLVNKIAKSQNNTKINDNEFLETLATVKEDDLQRQSLEKQRLGAMTVSELNRLYFKI